VGFGVEVGKFFDEPVPVNQRLSFDHLDRSLDGGEIELWLLLTFEGVLEFSEVVEEFVDGLPDGIELFLDLNENEVEG
jgi:hypothetical protein